jgi:probable HAF family extracellular repeat protein
MKSTRSIFVAAAVSVVVLGISLSLPARPHPQGGHKIRYIVKDIGSLGGSFASAGGISNTGWVVGYSLLPGDNVVHEFLWHDGVMKDLGTLGGPNSFSEYRLNDFGNAGGESDTITPDPNGEDFCAFGTQLICLPFYLQNGKKIPQPLLGGNNGSGFSTNDLGEMVGTAQNNTVEPTCLPLGETLQYKPVIWRNGRVHELQTFPGDPIGLAYVINNRGQAVGQSGPCGIESVSGLNSHALLWNSDKPTDLGNLGGAQNNLSQDVNALGEVVGLSDLPGDATFHAFIWRGKKMIDLGTLPGDVHSNGEAINIEGQVVGRSSDADFDGGAFVWQNGVMTDMNTLIPANSPFTMDNATCNNDLGQIVGSILITSTGEIHAFIATPVLSDEYDDSASANVGGATVRRPHVVLPELIRRMPQQQRRRMIPH